MVKRVSAIRFRPANHIIGDPFDPPRWAEEPWLRRKRDLSEGSGTTVAVVDSGISRHPWLRGNYAEPLPPDASDVWDLAAAPLPRHVGHGTFVAGVILQYAPRTMLLPRRVMNLDGEANDPDLAAVIDALCEHDPDVVNISLAPEVDSESEGTSRTMAAISRLQETRGTVVVVAAGNNGERFPEEHLAPEHELTVVVGALDLSGRRAWFSNRHFVNIWAPGVDVLSSFVHWDGLLEPTDEGDDHHDSPAEHVRSPHPVRPVAPFAGWARWNGTSFAAPAVSGAIAAEISALSTIADRRERRLAALHRVYDTARDIDVDGEKGKALSAAPVALEGPPRAAHHAGFRNDGHDH